MLRFLMNEAGQAHYSWQVTDFRVAIELMGEPLLGSFELVQRTVIGQPVGVIAIRG
jgi:hypothetical protein